MTEINDKWREPNKTEQIIIERCIALTKYGYIEMFIIFAALDLAVIYLVFLFFSDSWIMGGMFLILSIVMSHFLLNIWNVIKQCRISDTYQIQSEEGIWSIDYEGDTARTKQFVSKINGKYITMPVPEMARPPEYKKPKNIEYEYLKIFEERPPFGYNYIFISIDGNMLNEKDKDYINKYKPLGILSMILSTCFVVFLVFSFISKFEIEFTIYICLFLFIPFVRTLIFWKSNTKLRADFIKSMNS